MGYYNIYLVVNVVQSIACFEVNRKIDLGDIQRSIETYVPRPKRTINLACEPVDISTLVESRIEGNQVAGTMEMVRVENKTFRGHPYQVPVPYNTEFDFIDLSRLYLVVHAGRRTADQIAGELNRIIHTVGGIVLRKSLDNKKIRKLFRNVQGQHVSVLGSKAAAPPGKEMQYQKYIVGAVPPGALSPYPDIFYLTFKMKKYDDLTISVTDESQITLYNAAITMGKGKPVTVDKKFAKKFSIDEILPL
jgi:hypothetical protein